MQGGIQRLKKGVWTRTKMFINVLRHFKTNIGVWAHSQKFVEKIAIKLLLLSYSKVFYIFLGYHKISNSTVRVSWLNKGEGGGGQLVRVKYQPD